MWNLNSHKAEDHAEDVINDKGRNRGERSKDNRREREYRHDRRSGTALAKRGRVR